MADQNLKLLCRPLLAMQWAKKGLEVVEKQDVTSLLMPSTNNPIPGTGGEAVR